MKKEPKKEAPTKEREETLRQQLFLNQKEIAEIEACSYGCAQKIMINMRKWKQKNENKRYPRGLVLSEDFFNHFWLVIGNKVINKE